MEQRNFERFLNGNSIAQDECKNSQTSANMKKIQEQNHMGSDFHSILS